MEILVRVLLIDDDRDTTEFMKIYLRARGCEVHSANNGREGVRLACALVPDVVVTDYRMPVDDGCDVIKELRADAKTASIPIVLFTAALGPGSSRDLCGADICVPKPVNPDALYDAIQRLAVMRI
jgi:CheY-like chemotaxis protein